jgi:hypothetical protein
MTANSRILVYVWLTAVLRAATGFER